MIPFFSIIIPTLNRSILLDRTLKSIYSQVFNLDQIEIIVIDNGSTDNTIDICKFWNTKFLNFKYFVDSVPGLLTGRHRGYEESKGDILCFIDDDVELSSLWLFNIDYELKKNSDISLLTGPTLPKFETYPPNWLKNFSTVSIYGGNMCPSLSLIDLGHQSLFIDPIFVWGLNFIIKRKVFEFLKGFHPDNIISSLQFFQGDGETGLSLKAKLHGFKAYYSSGVLLYHFIPKERLNYEYFYKRYYYQGVADSFTALRRNAGLYEVICNESAPVSDKFFSVFIFLKKIKFYLFNFFKNRNDIVNPEHLSMTEALNEGYSAGYNFHQNHFNTNSVVKNWVLKDDYLNYKLPEL